MHSIISFFTGAGFLDLGFEKAGFRIDMVNEYSRSFLDCYMHSRSKLGSPRPAYGYHLGSVEDFEEGEFAETLRRVIADIRASGRKVGFVGGPPCPDFSVAGKNAGSEGDNGRLTATYFSLIEKFRPDFFIFENVQGLWSTKVHRQFYDAMKEKCQAGGYALHDRLVNALHYGVGQDRSRIFLFGALDGPEGLDFPWKDSMPYSDAAFSLPWPGVDDFEADVDKPCPNPDIPRELTVKHWFEANDVENHPNGDMAFAPLSDKFHTAQEGAVKKKSFKRLHRWRYSPTAAYGNNEVHLHPWKPRRISVAEAMAIQSLPKEFELPTDMTLSACFKTIGNGVPFLAAKGLATSVAAYLESAAGWKKTAPYLVAAE